MSKRREFLAEAIQTFIARKEALGITGPNLKTQVTDTSLYLASRLDGASNIVKLTNDKTDKAVGVTNFEGNKLAKGRDVIIDSMKIEVAQGGLALNDVNWLDDAINAPKGFLNSELKLIQKNDILLNIPVADLILKNEDDNYREIASRPFLTSDTPIEWVLEFPDGVTVPVEAVNGVFFKISIRGTQAIQ